MCSCSIIVLVVYVCQMLLFVYEISRLLHLLPEAFDLMSGLYIDESCSFASF